MRFEYKTINAQPLGEVTAETAFEIAAVSDLQFDKGPPSGLIKHDKITEVKDVFAEAAKVKSAYCVIVWVCGVQPTSAIQEGRELIMVGISKPGRLYYAILDNLDAGNIRFISVREQE